MDFIPDPAEVTRPRYRQEPYLRINLPEDTPDEQRTTVDGKALAWTAQAVLVKWIDVNGYTVHTRWLPAGRVQAITRDESCWRDPYDDLAHFYPDTPADGWL